jgi:hypothetical protein
MNVPIERLRRALASCSEPPPFDPDDKPQMAEHTTADGEYIRVRVYPNGAVLVWMEPEDKPKTTADFLRRVQA